MFKIMKFNVEMFLMVCNTVIMNIAYGYNRKPKDFKNLDIADGKFFLDNDFSRSQERLDMLMAIQEGDTVVLLSMADLGKGQSQKKAVAAIEATGATIKVQEDEAPKGKSGRPQTVNFASDDDLEKALSYWRNLPEKDALALIKRDFNLSPNRNRMNYLARKDANSTDEK